MQAKTKRRARPTPPRAIGLSVAETAARKARPLEQLEHLASHHAACELVTLPRADGGERVNRVATGWQPEAMLKRGQITPRQHDAALKLMADYDAAGFDKVKGQSWGEVVDSGAPSSDVPHRLAMTRRAVMDKLRALPPLVREVVEHVVLSGRTVETAGASLKATWLPANAKLRRTSARAFLGLGLELVADAYGIL